MRVLTWNVNGLRSVFRQGFAEWLEEERPDLVCVQEVKAQAPDLSPEHLAPVGYYSYFCFAVKKGYSGVGIYSRKPLAIIPSRLGNERFDSEGRMLLADAGDFFLLNLYLPHGGRQKENLQYKLECYRLLFDFLKGFDGKPLLLAGDFNVAHTQSDVANWRQNQNNIMFTPEERRQLDTLTAMGFTDTLRLFHEGPGYYTWWPYGFNSRERNIGWRIDYLFASPSLQAAVADGFTLPNVGGSDHGPAGLLLR